MQGSEQEWRHARDQSLKTLVIYIPPYISLSIIAPREPLSQLVCTHKRKKPGSCAHQPPAQKQREEKANMWKYLLH